MSYLLVENNTEDASDSEDFAECIAEIVDISPSFNKLDIFIRKSYEKGLESIIHKRLAKKRMNRNWDVDYRIVIK